MQRTRFQRFTQQLGSLMLGLLRGNWRHRSAVLLALLVGFYLGGNLTSYVLLVFPGGRPLAVLTLVVALELLVRLRGRWLQREPGLQSEPGLGWLITDNLRIGFVYSIVLEAFKVGT